MVCIPVLAFSHDRLTIQPSDSKVLGTRATWLLPKRRERFDRCRVRQHFTGLYDRVFGTTFQPVM